MFMEPMPTPQGTAIAIALLAIVAAGVALGFLWMRRLTGLESVHVFRSTAPAGRRWPAYAIGAGVLLLAVVVLLLNLTVQM